MRQLLQLSGKALKLPPPGLHSMLSQPVPQVRLLGAMVPASASL